MSLRASLLSNDHAEALVPKLWFLYRCILRVDDVHHLDLGEAEQTPRTVLHADSRPLRAAEGQIRRDREMLIHPGRAAFELRRHFGAAIRILRPDRSTESVVSRIRAFDRVIDIFVG